MPPAVGVRLARASVNSELLVPRGPSCPMEGCSQPLAGRGDFGPSAAALEAPSARATATAVIVDQLRIRHHLVKRRTQNPTPNFATHRPWFVPRPSPNHKCLFRIG